jgi:alpha-D-xyloside xylohydrolase
MNSDNRRDIYLPEGEWIHFFTGERLTGSRWYKDVEVPLDLMPVFVRPGTIIPVYEKEVDCTDQIDWTETGTLVIDDRFKGVDF